MKYVITKKLLSNTEIVKYQCSDCATSLWAPLTKAGSSDRCPNCSLAYVIPGKDEIDRRRRQEDELRMAALSAKAQEEAKQAADAQRLRAAHNAMLVEQIQKRREQKERLLKRVNDGLKFYVYISVYLETEWRIDQKELGAFSIEKLQRLGADGFEVKQVIPKTYGHTLQNVSLNFSSLGDQTHAGAVSGNIVGVHVLLSKLISSQDIVLDEHDFLESYLEEISF